jgi:LacI family gluconate utilization system Gnt-I transcriptional repressor
MTVSRVLRGRGVVSLRTRENVTRVVEEVGYVPNRLAGSLARARSDQVAVVIPSFVNGIFDELMDGLSGGLARMGYNPVVGISDYDEGREEQLIHSMLSWRPAGVVLPAIGHTRQTRAMLGNAGIPVVEVMNTSRPSPWIRVGIDQHAAGRRTAEHLLNSGRRRLGWIGTDPRDLSAVTRLAGLQEVVTSRGAALTVGSANENGPITPLGGREGLAALLEAAPETDAVVFANDTAAAGGMMHCLANAISVPDSLAIVGYGNTMSGQVLHKRLATISPPRQEIGRMAARCILAALDDVGPEPPSGLHDMGFELVHGETA